MIGLRIFAAVVLGLSGTLAHAQPAPTVSDAAKELIGAWEISNSDRDRRCAVTFSVDPAPGGFKLEFDPECGNSIPQLKDVVAWALDQNEVLRLIDAKNVAVFEFNEVESGLYESERMGEGLYFMQTQAALKIETHSAEQLFGDWQILREIDRPLCRLTLSNAADGESYKIVVKPGCNAEIGGFGLSTWRLDRDQLILSGRAGSWRFTESDQTIWERVPLSTDPLLLMKQ